MGIPLGDILALWLLAVYVHKCHRQHFLFILRVQDFYSELICIYGRLVITELNCFLSVKCSWVKFFIKCFLYFACLTLLFLKCYVTHIRYGIYGHHSDTKALYRQYLFQVSVLLLQVCLAGTQLCVCLQFKKQRYLFLTFAKKNVKVWTKKANSLWNPWTHFTAMLLLVSGHGKPFLLKGKAFYSATNFNECYINTKHVEHSSSVSAAA